VSRVRAGEWIAGAGALALLVTLFLPWFDPAGESGWESLGWVTLALAISAIGCGGWLILATAAARPIAQQVAAGVLTATAGTLAFVFLALRTLVFQPGPNDAAELRYGAWLGLLAVLVVAVGGWWSIKDERTDAPESAYTPPAPRPAPPAA
jgi:cation transport ATPase